MLGAKLLKTDRLTIRINPSVKKELCKRAEEGGESLTDLVTRIALKELGKTEINFLTALASN